GNIALWAQLAVHRSEIELRRGDTASAAALIDESYRILGDGVHDESWLSYRALVRAWEGRLDAAKADGEAALAMGERDGNRLLMAMAYHALGFVELSAGRPTAAAAHYDCVIGEMNAMGWRHPSLVVWQGNAVEAMVASGRRADATAIVDELETMGVRF